MKNLPLIILILLSVNSFAQNQIGTNIGSLADYSSEITFVNVFNQSREWIPFEDGGAWNSGVSVALGSDGYPVEIPYDDGINPPQYVRTLMLWDIDGLYPSGEYRLIASGTGQVTLSGAANGTFTCPVDQVVNVNGSGGIILTINSSASSDPVNDIRLIIPGSHDTYQTAPFNPSFLSFISDFETIRFMDLMDTNFSPVVSWSDRSLPEYYTQTLENGMAYEYLVELCNTTQKNAWVCIPHQADDDFVTQFATMLRDGLDPNLSVYVEYTNEAWNGIFTQTQYVETMGTGLGYTGESWERGWKYYAKRSADVHHIFETVFDDDNRLVNVVASQTVDFVSDYILSRYEEIDFNPNQVQAEALANAPYFGGGIADAVGDAGLANTITVEAILDSMEYSSLPQTFSAMQEGMSVAQNHNVDYIAYEGGQHLVSYAYTSNANFIDTLIAVNRDPRMEDLYCQYFDYWYNTLGGGLFCQFSSHFKPGIHGSWGVKEHMNDTLSPKYLGLQNCVFNAGTGGDMISGCINSMACNFDPEANTDDGSCLFIVDACGECGGSGTIAGCMDNTACNFNSLADCDDESCILPDGCVDSEAVNFNSVATCDDGSCIYAGCTYSQACNYMSIATLDDGSCEYSSCVTMGCTYDNAINYDSTANDDDGSCLFDETSSGCPEDLNADGIVNTQDLLLFLGGFGNICE